MSSPKTARRLNRILGMLPWVIAHPGASVEDVCTRFGYTRRQLVDDLNLVFVCGLPGYGPGDLMVAYLDEDEVVIEMADYFSSPVRLTAPEALGLLAAGMALVSTGQASDALRTAVGKLESVLLPDGAESLYIDLAEPAYVGDLRTAVAGHRAVEMEYAKLSTGASSKRTVEPWSVFSTLGNWYLSAFCREAGAERVFRIDRIRALHVTDDRFDPPTEVPPPEVRYTPGEDDVRSVIELESAARWVADYYPVEVVEEDPRLVVRFSSSDPSVAARLLVRLGSDARLREGPEVADAVADLRRRILTRYEGASAQ